MVFLSCIFPVSGALPAGRRAQERHSVEDGSDTGEHLIVPSNSRESFTVGSVPGRPGKTQAGHMLPVGRGGSAGAAGLTAA